MNKVELLGRLTKDPEVRNANGNTVARYTLAVNRSYKREGEPDADFINIVAFGRRGEFAGKWFKKGMQVVVVGELRIGSFEGRDGQRRYTTDVIVSEQYFADGSRGNAAQAAPAAPVEETPAPADDDFNGGFTVPDFGDDEELPFA